MICCMRLKMNNGIGKVYRDSGKVVYQNIFLESCLDSLTVINCASNKVFVEDIILVK